MYIPYTPYQHQVCPTCGHCPTCGRKTTPYQGILGQGTISGGLGQVTTVPNLPNSGTITVTNVPNTIACNAGDNTAQYAE